LGHSVTVCRNPRRIATPDRAKMVFHRPARLCRRAISVYRFPR
jgi:hypothetical protein